MNRRSLLGSTLLTVAALLKWPRSIGTALADDKNWRHGVSLFGDLKYPAGFRHFDYVNADAPRGGAARKRPDFAAKNEQGAIKAYVEVTTVNPSAELVGQMNRENRIYEAIDSVNIPNGSILGYHLVKAGSDSPPLARLVSSVEEWARDNIEAAKHGEAVRTFDAGQWRIELELYACTRLKPRSARSGAPSGSGVCGAA